MAPGGMIVTGHQSAVPVMALEKRDIVMTLFTNKLTEKQIDALLVVFAEHDRTSCSDKNSVNGFYTRSDKGFRCTRCALLDLTRGGIAGNFKLDISVMDSYVNEQGQTAADILPGIEAQLKEFGLKVVAK